MDETRKKSMSSFLSRYGISASAPREGMNKSALPAPQSNCLSNSYSSLGCYSNNLHDTTSLLNVTPESISHRVHEKRIERLYCEMEKHKAEAAREAIKYQQLERKMIFQQQEHNREITSLKSTLKKLEETNGLVGRDDCVRLKELENELNEYKERNRLATEHATLIENSLTNGYNRYKTLQNDFDEIEKVKNGLEQKMLEKDGNLAIADADKKRLEAELELANSKTSKLQTEKAELIAELDNVKTQLLKRSNEMASWKLIHERAEFEKSTIEDLDNARATITRLKHQLNQITRTEQNELILNEQIFSLKQQIEILKEQHQIILDENASLKVRIVDSAHGKASMSMVDQLTVELGRAHADIKRLQKGGEEIKFAELKDQLKARDAEIEKMKKIPTQSQDANESVTRVLHFEENPTALAIRERANDISSLSKENERLKERVALLEALRRDPAAADVDLTGNVTALVNDRLDANDKQKIIDDLERKLDEANRRFDRAKQGHKVITQQYRETCMLLTGYQIKMKGEDGNLFEVASMLDRSSNEDACLLFKRDNGGHFDLLHNEYAENWSELASQYLIAGEYGSIPAFLSSITMHFFDDYINTPQEERQSKPLMKKMPHNAEQMSQPFLVRDENQSPFDMSDNECGIHSDGESMTKSEDNENDRTLVIQQQAEFENEEQDKIVVGHIYQPDDEPGPSYKHEAEIYHNMNQNRKRRMPLVPISSSLAKIGKTDFDYYNQENDERISAHDSNVDDYSDDQSSEISDEADDDEIGFSNMISKKHTKSMTMLEHEDERDESDGSSSIECID